MIFRCNYMEKLKISVIGLSGLSVFVKCDHFPVEGETALADTFHIEYGGKGFNQAIAAKRCGIDVSFLTAFGDDDIKDKAIKCLNDEGIKVFPIIKKGKESGAATILIDKDGRNRVTCFPGASLDLTKDDVKMFEDEIKQSDILLLQLESSDEALYEAIDIAAENEVKVILNPAPAHLIKEEYLKKCYLITPNELEYQMLFGTKDIKELGLNVITTLGDKGCIGMVNGSYFEIKAPSLKAINTTGAGDTFNGILASMIVKGNDVNLACKYAVKGASISVTKEFVIDSIPYLDEIIK